MEKKGSKDYFKEFQIGAQLHSIGKFQEAAEHLTESMRLNPNFYLTYLELAIIGIKCGKIIESKPLLLKSLSLQEHEMAWSHLGIIEAYEGNVDNAIHCFEKAVSLNPKNADLRYNLGKAFQQSGNHERAKQELSQAANLNPYYKDKIN